MVSRLGGHTITRIRPPERDKNGDPVPGSGSEVDIGGCSVQPRQSTEATDLRNTVTTGLVAFVPAGADIAATDRIRWNGTVYAVDGEPAAWDDLNGAPDHVEVALRRVEG
jgi:hypothetical protein